jgi:predicted O-methyltransferase YrrM
MLNILKIYELSKDKTAIDFNHVMFLYSSVISLKPKRCLNLGIGPGTSAFAILEGLEYNQTGSLDCLDNFCDNLLQTTLDELKEKNVTIIQGEERDYVASCESNSYDLILSDADHLHADEWTNEIFRIATPDAFLFFHDVANNDYPNLRKHIKIIENKGLPHFLFNTVSRSDERCDKSGFLFVINKK